MQAPARPLWLLPLVLALVPVLATHLAFALSVADGHVPSCLPYLEGCTSISRAARHGDGNLLFRLLMLPMALLLALHWLLARDWLASLAGARRSLRALPGLGALAALALAVYVAYLGSEGDIYRFLRRHGVIWYFAASYLAMLVQLRASWPLRAMLGRGALALQLGVALVLLAMGIASVAASATLDGIAKDHVENALEWNLGLGFTLWYLAQARLWWRARLVLRTDTSAPPR